MIAMDVKEIRRKNFVFMVDKLKADSIYKNQEEMAKAMGLTNGSYISQLKSGTRNIDDAKARDLEVFFKLERNSFDLPMGEPVIGQGHMADGILRPNPDHMSMYVENDDYVYVNTSDFVLVPQFDVKGACGLGYTNSDELIKGGLVFKEAWLRSKGISPKFGCSAIMGGDGDSMLPTIDSSNIILANLAINTFDQIQSGKIYAFVSNNELRIKRLFKNLKDGGLRIVSDNPNKEIYPDEFLSKEEIDNIKIVAHLPWRGGDL
ncbi:LexA family transcriptional regulator [Acinetobacter guerrae]|uniref:LexA family transcriptional regulator n=1 Tax=Acinetobacter guerrae TaxID=1843371 RepID=A0A3A8ERQ7_9GAMM|nr:LexA family transcriptional regulator [Acinetobacter guerrae]RKG33420.1 LexA family transcriptional regulator [Acinetobacter guerrae]